MNVHLRRSLAADLLARAVCICAAAAAIAMPATAQEAYYNVLAGNLRCVVENIDKYKALMGDAIPIDLAICPETKATDDLSAGGGAKLGAAMPGAPPPRLQREGGVADSGIDFEMTFGHSELDCLVAYAETLDLSDPAQLVEVPIDICAAAQG